MHSHSHRIHTKFYQKVRLSNFENAGFKVPHPSGRSLLFTSLHSSAVDDHAPCSAFIRSDGGATLHGNSHMLTHDATPSASGESLEKKINGRRRNRRI